jgi:hypothetical protein
MDKKHTWREVQRLLEDEDFREWCAENETTPAEALHPESYSRADKCENPLFFKRTHPETGVFERVAVPCDSNNADVCRECSEFKRRLRQAQILTEIGKGQAQVGFFTLTCPSFGQVHRATWTVKDDFRTRQRFGNDEAALYHARLTAQRTRTVCGCGEHHTWEEPRIGTPLGAYDYVGEVLWSKNLPKLVKSTTRKLRRIAENFGISAEEFSFFLVYERQKRGSLHAHMLLLVKGNPRGFKLLSEHLQPENHTWASPTAEIADEELDAAAAGLAYIQEDADLLNMLPVGRDHAVLDAAKWSNTGAATRWGSIYDYKVLAADAPEMELLDEETLAEPSELPDVQTFKRSAAYLAKYLTKNNSAFSAAALKRLSPAQKRHYARFRRAAVYLYVEQTLRAAEIRERERRLEALWEACLTDTHTGEVYPPDELPEMVYEELEAYDAATRTLSALSLVPTPLGQWFSSRLVRGDLTLPEMNHFVENTTLTNSHVHTEVPLRYLKMKLNRVANNGGFTGTLVTTHNWTTLTELKQARIEWFYSAHPEAERVEYHWTAWVEERDNPLVLPKRQDFRPKPKPWGGKYPMDLTDLLFTV